MRIWRWVAVAAFAGVVPGAGAQVPLPHIPAVHGTALSGERVELPAAFEGKVGVLVVGFSQASRGQVTAWGKRLAGDYRESTRVVYYEMPVLESVPRLLRSWVLKKIRDQVPEREQARFLPLLDHESDWKKVAGYGKADEAYVLIVDAGGAVRGKVEGTASDAAYAEVRRRVEGVQQE